LTERLFEIAATTSIECLNAQAEEQNLPRQPERERRASVA
jgi:hypothetical protein